MTQLLWPRYGRYWWALVAEAGLTPQLPEREAVRERFATPVLAGVPGVAFRLAAAQALALGDCDTVVLPALVRESGVARGAGQDPWVMALEASLRSQVAGVAQLRTVPSWFDGATESVAVAFLQSHVHDPALVRRALERARPYAQPPKPPAPAGRAGPAEGPSVGLLAQPWLVGDSLERLAGRPGERIIGQHRIDPEQARADGWRVDERLVDSDAEVVGAARALARRAGVSGLRLVVDEESGSDAWLARHVRRLVHKPLEVVTLQALLEGLDAVDALEVPQLD